jgi:hypothetical protein
VKIARFFSRERGEWLGQSWTNRSGDVPMFRCYDALSVSAEWLENSIPTSKSCVIDEDNDDELCFRFVVNISGQVFHSISLEFAISTSWGGSLKPFELSSLELYGDLIRDT